jgi:hypothetical protein
MSQDLYPTPTRLNLLADIEHDDGHSVVYFEANEWWDDLGFKRTAAIGQVVGAGWVTNEKTTPETKRSGELAGRIYARLTDAGRSVLKGQRPDA